VERGIALFFCDLGTRRMCGKHHAPASLAPGKDTLSIVQDAVWA
jgi:hypothetical protein